MQVTAYTVFSLKYRTGKMECPENFRESLIIELKCPVWSRKFYGPGFMLFFFFFCELPSPIIATFGVHRSGPTKTHTEHQRILCNVIKQMTNYFRKHTVCWNTADCKSLATRKRNSGKPQLIYHVWIWLSFPPQRALPLCSSTINQLWFSTVQLQDVVTSWASFVWLHNTLSNNFSIASVRVY